MYPDIGAGAKGYNTVTIQNTAEFDKVHGEIKTMLYDKAKAAHDVKGTRSPIPEGSYCDATRWSPFAPPRKIWQGKTMTPGASALGLGA